MMVLDGERPMAVSYACADCNAFSAFLEGDGAGESSSV